MRGAPAELAAREREGRVKPKSETERGMRERDVLVSPPHRQLAAAGLTYFCIFGGGGWGGVGECESLRGRVKSKGLGNRGWWVGSMGKGSMLMD